MAEDEVKMFAESKAGDVVLNTFYNTHKTPLIYPLVNQHVQIKVKLSTHRKPYSTVLGF